MLATGVVIKWPSRWSVYLYTQKVGRPLSVDVFGLVVMLCFTILLAYSLSLQVY